MDADGRVVLSPTEQQAIGLELVTAARDSLSTSDVRYGRVLAPPTQDQRLVAPADGRVQAPRVAVGDTVAAGRSLITLDLLPDAASRADALARRGELRGRIEAAQASARAAQLERDRQAHLLDSGLATPQSSQPPRWRWRPSAPWPQAYVARGPPWRGSEVASSTCALPSPAP